MCGYLTQVACFTDLQRFPLKLYRKYIGRHMFNEQYSFPYYFNIGSLTLKIPWKKLYTQPVEAVLEEIYLLIVPSSSKLSKIHILNRKIYIYLFLFHILLLKII